MLMFPVMVIAGSCMLFSIAFAIYGVKKYN